MIKHMGKMLAMGESAKGDMSLESLFLQLPCNFENKTFFEIQLMIHRIIFRSLP